MKKYFLNLAKVFLFGAAFAVVGCTDYDEDIRELNERIDTEILEGQIAPLKTDLAQTKADLEAADAAMKAALDAQIADVNALIAQLGAKHDADIVAVNQALDDKIAAVNQSISDLNSKHDTDIKNLTEAMNAGDAALEGKLNEAIAQATEAVLALQEAMNKADIELANKIETLNKDLVAAQEALNKAIADGDAATLAEAQKALTAAETALKSEIAAVKAELEGKIGDLRTEMLAKVKEAQDAMQKALDEAVATLNAKDVDLQNQIDTIKKDLAALTQTVEDNYKELKGDLAALESKLQAQIDRNNKLIVANQQAITENKGEIQKLFGEVEALKGELATLTGRVSDINKSLVEHIEKFNTFQVAYEAKIAEILAKIETLATQISEIKEVILPAMQAQIDANAELGKQNAADIKKNEDLFNAYKAATNATLEQLKNADAVLTAAIAAVGDDVEALSGELQQHVSDFETYKDNIRTELEEKWNSLANVEAAVADLAIKHETDNQILTAKLQIETARIDALYTMLANEQTAREDKDVVLEAAIAGLASRVSTLELEVADLKDADAALAAQIVATEEALTELLYKTVDNAREELTGVIAATKLDIIESYIVPLQAQVNKLAEEIARVEKEYKEALAAEKAAREAADAALQGQINNILARVQSLVYVPEYSDGKATINWVELNGQVVEGRSQMTFQVHPQECAEWIAKAWSEEAEGSLQFYIQDVKVRSRAATGEEVLNIVGATVTDAAKGYITFDVEARNLCADFYYPEAAIQAGNAHSYSVALVAEKNDTTNVSSEYVNLIAADVKTIDMAVFSSTDIDITNKDFAPQTIEYTSKDTVKVLNGHKVKFNLDGAWKTIEEMTELGYALEVEQKVSYIVLDENNNVFVNTENVNKQEIVEKVVGVSLSEAKPEAVGNRENVLYSYTANGLTVGAGSMVEIIPIQTKLGFQPETIAWNYDADAAQDAAAFAGGTAVYTRTDVALTESANADSTNIANASITFADLVKDPASLTSIKVTLDGADVADVTAALSADADGNALLALDNFAWDKNYVVVANYSLSNTDVIVTLPVSTVDRSRAPIVIDFGDVHYTYAKDLVIPDGTLPVALDTIHSAITYDLGSFAEDAAAFLTEVMVDNEWSLVLNTVGPKTTKEDNWTTNFKIAEDGQTASTNYTYASFDEVLPNVQYIKEFNLWYGQNVTIKRNLVFDQPKLDYVHSMYYVKGDAANGWYSQVQGLYTDGNGEYDYKTLNLKYFGVSEVNMQAAFLVWDTEGNKALTEEEIVAAGLVREFEFEDDMNAAGYQGITWNADKANFPNCIVYNDRAASVNVYGKLGIQNTNGSIFWMTTSFDTTYANYLVKKYDPIYNISADDVVLQVTQPIVYDVNLMKYLTVNEWRNGLVWDVNLVDTEKGGWLLGNGYNGLAQGVVATDQTLYGFEQQFSNLEEGLSTELKQYVSFDQTTGLFTFDNKNNMYLQEDVVLPVTFKISYIWGVKEVSFKITLKKNAPSAE